MIISKETSSRHSERTKALQNTNSALRIAKLLPLFEATVILDFEFNFEHFGFLLKHAHLLLYLKELQYYYLFQKDSLHCSLCALQ